MKNKNTDMKNRFADRGKSHAGYFLRFVFCLVLTAAASLAQAQNRNQVSGKVTDKAGEPLIGATVVVVGTTTGATTGADGRFTIGVPAGGELKISYIGYVEQTVKVGAQSVLDIVLEEDSQMLKDVVVIGYGTMEKKSVTSSISSIKGDDLVAGMGGSTIATALQGKIPGLTISGSASPNSSNDFQLRGVASVNASKGPLVIIDGIPGGDMRALNQEDIESVDVLKDASAGAIYGTRAAGGVILVTTKQARQGRVTARYTGEFSVEAIRKTPDLLSSGEYVEYGLGEDYGHDTDWYKELTNELPFSQRHSVSISGGSNVAQVYTSFMAQNQKGIVIGDNRKDYSGRVNAKFNLFDGVVEIRANAQFREAERDNRNSSGIFKMAFGLNPTIPLRDPANPSNYNIVGNGISGTSFNPVADIMLRTNNGKDQWLLADATVKINLMKGLSLQGTVGIDKRQYQQYTYVSHDHKESIDNSRRGGASHKFSKDNRVSIEAYANYHKVFREDHTLDAVAGYSFWQAGGEDFSISGTVRSGSTITWLYADIRNLDGDYFSCVQTSPKSKTADLYALNGKLSFSALGPGSYELFIEAVDENYNYMQKCYPFKVSATDICPDGRHADYAEGIQWVIDEGISNGTSAAKFLPDEQCTRAQVVTFIWRAAGRPAPKSGTCTFYDVSDGSYCAKAVQWAVEQGITKGVSAGYFDPYGKVTRAQFVTLLWRYLGQTEPGIENPFADIYAGTFCYRSVLWAYENGVTTGTGEYTFSPNSVVSRAQVATFLYRALDQAEKPVDPVEPTEPVDPEPTEPVEPTDPVDPVEPTEPAEAA